MLTSQRVVDVVLKAFGACAASQGCMNNITFGDETMGYYETVAGGSGAGSDWDGRSGIHSHMTNTRITDAEVLERRYPVILRSFSLRNGSGGHGKYRGGDGISRELLFRKTMTLSVLTERRVYAPYGLEGDQLVFYSGNLFHFHFSIRWRGRCQRKQFVTSSRWSSIEFRGEMLSARSCRGKE